MKNKKVNVKKVLYIILVVVLSIALVASLVFGSIAAFTTNAKEAIETWYFDTYEKELSLLKTSVIVLIASSLLLTLTLSFDEFKKKFID